MPGAPGSASGQHAARRALADTRALGDLIGAVLLNGTARRLGRSPALAGPGVVHATVDTRSSTRRPSPTRDRVPGPDPVGPDSAGPDSAGPDPVEPQASEPVDTDHIDTDHIDTDHIETDHIETAHIETDHIETDHIETWELVRRAQGGDGEAFGQLYDRYVDVVYRFVYFRVNDRTLAEDFTSETFLRALRRINSFSYQGRDIGAWFVTIARNIVLDHVKSARHRLEVSTGETIEAREHAQSTDAIVLTALTNERLMSAVRQLGADQRDCILLRFIQGLSVSETAAVMGKNDGAIKALQHRAVRKLAELVGNDLR